MRKKRILFCGEASFLHTGYAVYAREVLSRLYNLDEFEIAEFGSFAHHKDPRVNSLPWKFYGNLPDTPEQTEVYNSSTFNNFGAWRFNDVVLDFLPDVIYGFRDVWMMQHETESPLRPYFAYCQMPTVDSYAQDPSWIYGFSTVDYITTYQDWSLEVLKNEAGDLLNTVYSTPPAANPAAYFPAPDKQALKKHLLGDDYNVVGMVARNQIRKLFPHLVNAFKLTLAKLPAEVADKTLLYFHTSFPDAGWPIDRMVAESGIADKIRFTYVCEQCKHFQPMPYSSKVCNCPKCGKFSFAMPNVQLGLPDQALGAIMNLFDAYVQHHISEGFGMCQVEAAYCGVSVFGTNFSASEDILEKIGGEKVAISQYFKEAPTYMTRAFPDDDDLAEKLSNFLLKPSPIRAAIGQRTAVAAREHFSYDKTTDRLARIFREATPKLPWNFPPQLFRPATQIPNIMSNEDFVRWAIMFVLGDKSKLDTYFHMKLLKDLNEGLTIDGGFGFIANDASMLTQKVNWSPFNREKLVEHLKNMRGHINHWEQRRYESVMGRSL